MKTQNYLAPIFENIITHKIKIKTKNHVVIKDDINNKNNNLITLISKITKRNTFKNFLKKNILFVRLYDKQLYLFLSKITNLNKGLFEPKSTEKVNKIKNINNKKIKQNTNLSQRKMLTPRLSPHLTPLGEKMEARVPLNVVQMKQAQQTNVLQSNLINTNLALRQLENSTIPTRATTVKNKSLQPKINIIKYLKAISIFNSEIASSQNIIYQFNKGNKILDSNVNNIITFLEYSFISMSSFISKPVFVFTPNKIVIQFFYFLKGKKKQNLSLTKSDFLSLNNKKLQLLCLHLSKLYKKPVELELDRLYYPHFDSKILSNIIGLCSDVIKWRKIIRDTFSIAKFKTPIKFVRKTRSSLIPSFLSGLKIKLAGRLLTQRVAPRMTVRTTQKGALARGKVNFANSARFTTKNRKGAYSVTVYMGHVFF